MMKWSFATISGMKVFGYFSLIICFSSISMYTWADRANALQAQSEGDYGRAVRLWQELANTGDPVAQYNLALLYRQGTGVLQDQKLSRYWLSMAARGSIADAYSELNGRSISPVAKRTNLSLVETPIEWVARQNPAYYTLQLASSMNEKLIAQYYAEYQLAGKAGYYRSFRDGAYWYALVYGVYPTVNQARTAINDLPSELKKWSPWVRNIKSIHELMNQ